MSDLCINIETLLAIYATITAQLQDHNPSPPEVIALEQLKASGIRVPSKKRKREGETRPNKKAQADKTDKENTPIPKTEKELDQIADDRINALLPDTLPPPMTAQEFVQCLIDPKAVITQEDEDKVVLEMACGFAAPEDPSGWEPILKDAGIHSDQKVTIQTTIAAAAAKVLGQPMSLVAAESNLLSLVKTASVDTYAVERVLICETMYTQRSLTNTRQTRRS
ncbi:hypothetical protein B0H12DRAFT_46671 [Mycena haematopus]|nr:hypothetical protein B0H12DRAFT_46671 [Mycena haematopus]